MRYKNFLIFYFLIRGRREGVQVNKDIFFIYALFFMASLSKYDKNGWVTDLTNLNSGRRLHACGHYYSETNELVIFDT